MRRDTDIKLGLLQKSNWGTKRDKDGPGALTCAERITFLFAMQLKILPSEEFASETVMGSVGI